MTAGSRRIGWQAPALLLIYLAIAAIGFGPSLGDAYGFRQYQTAITAQHWPGWAQAAAYSTPVLGPPWRIPFEFPLYQGLAHSLSMLGLPLITAGRLLSMAALLACWPSVRQIARLHGIHNATWLMAPVLLSPFYAFWSRAFMIETLALALSLGFAALALTALQRARLRPLMATATLALGIGAALTKITTVLPLLLVVAVAAAGKRWQPAVRGDVRNAAGVLVIVGAVLLSAWGWTWYADQVKAQHPIAQALTSTSLQSWNFGTLAQRLNADSWRVMLVERPLQAWASPLEAPVPLTTGWAAVAALGLSALWFRQCTPAARWQVLALLGAYLGPMLLFTNLHLVHGYYQAANAGFLLMAFGRLALGAQQASGSAAARRGTALAFAVALAVLATGSVVTLATARAASRPFDRLAAEIRAVTAPHQTLLVTGLDWSSELPYLAQRRALMLPGWLDATRLDAVAAAVTRDGSPPVAWVACGAGADLAEALLARLGQGRGERLASADGCTTYRLRPAAS